MNVVAASVAVEQRGGHAEVGGETVDDGPIVADVLLELLPESEVVRIISKVADLTYEAQAGAQNSARAATRVRLAPPGSFSKIADLDVTWPLSGRLKDEDVAGAQIGMYEGLGGQIMKTQEQVLGPEPGHFSWIQNLCDKIRDRESLGPFVKGRMAPYGPCEDPESGDLLAHSVDVKCQTAELPEFQGQVPGLGFRIRQRKAFEHRDQIRMPKSCHSVDFVPNFDDAEISVRLDLFQRHEMNVVVLPIGRQRALGDELSSRRQVDDASCAGPDFRDHVVALLTQKVVEIFKRLRWRHRAATASPNVAEVRLKRLEMSRIDWQRMASAVFRVRLRSEKSLESRLAIHFWF